jgi:hypothetical protein
MNITLTSIHTDINHLSMTFSEELYINLKYIEKATNAWPRIQKHPLQQN